MNSRPLSVTIVAWFLIVTSVVAIVSIPFTLDNPLAHALMERSPVPVAVQLAINYAGMAIGLISGIFILRRENWARVLYVAWGVIGLVVGLFTAPLKSPLLLGALLLAAIAFILFRPPADAWFGKSYFGGSAE